MPNDIHNTRIEDGISSTAFRDFVAKDAGTNTVNRYLPSTATLPSGAGCTAVILGGSRR